MTFCVCPCGEKIGEFEPFDDDYSGVIVKCNKCNKLLELLNLDLHENDKLVLNES